MKNLMRIACLLLLGCFTGLACQKDNVKPNSCDDGTCCVPGKGTYYVLGTVINEPADLTGVSVGAGITGIQFKNQYLKDKMYPYSGGIICELSAGKLKDFTASASNLGPFNYKYKVNGVMYTSNSETFTGVPLDYFFITHIELSN